MVSLPKQMESETDGDYEVFRNIPVFDEHTGDDGVVYDKRRLQCIADNNNHRIDDTNDWCPVIPGHTPDEPGQEQPEILGWAGPFKVGVIGNVDHRHCIFADFRIHRDHAETFRKNPRRSVELWPEENPDDRFFDPIAILGAETPKRPLGMTRYKATAGKARIRYEMGADVTPVEGGGGNTFIPGGTGKKKKQPQTFNQEGNDMIDGLALTPEFMAQLMEAQAPLLQAMIDEALSNLVGNDALEQSEPEAEEPGLEGITGADPMPDNATPPAPAPPMEGEAPPGMPPMEPEGEMPPPDEPAAPSDGPPPEDMPTGAPDEDEEKKRTPFQKYAHAKCMKFMCADESEHKTDAMDYALKFAQDRDEDEAAEMADVYGMGEDDGQKSFYAKLKFAMGEGEDPMTPETTPGNKEPVMDQYAKKYAKVIAEKHALANRNAVLEAKNVAAEKAVKYGKRVAALSALAEEYHVPEDEITHVESMTDVQFDAHVARIPQTYQRAQSPRLASEAHTPDNTPADTKADAISVKARAAVEKYSKPGKRIPYMDAFHNVEANNGEYVPA